MKECGELRTRKKIGRLIRLAGAEHGIFATGKEFGRAPKRENIRRVLVYAAAYPFSMRSRSSIAPVIALSQEAE